MASRANYDNLGTFEFLVEAGSTSSTSGTSTLNSDSPFAFIETNPRLQVEHMTDHT